MKRNIILSFIAMILTSSIVTAQQSTKVHVLAQGVHCERCVLAIRKSIGRVKGAKFDASHIQVGDKPKYFSEPFKIELNDSKIGPLGKAVANANTPHEDEIPPSLNVVLYTPQSITEEVVMDLRSELANVSGVEVFASGSLGGFPNRLFFWLRLSAAGGADWNEILTAANRATKISFTRQ